MKRLEEYPNYSVTKCGQVWSNTRNVFLKSWVNRHGYSQVKLYNGKGALNKNIHRLVAESYITGDVSLMVNHIDGNKTNNHVDNLEWTSRSNNTLHARDTPGLVSGRQKLSPEDLVKIRELLSVGTLSGKEIGVMFGVGQCAISCIKTGRTWTDNYETTKEEL